MWMPLTFNGYHLHSFPSFSFYKTLFLHPVDFHFISFPPLPTSVLPGADCAAITPLPHHRAIVISTATFSLIRTPVLSPIAFTFQHLRTNSASCCTFVPSSWQCLERCGGTKQKNGESTTSESLPVAMPVKAVRFTTRHQYFSPAPVLSPSSSSSSVSSAGPLTPPSHHSVLPQIYGPPKSHGSNSSPPSRSRATFPDHAKQQHHNSPQPVRLHSALERSKLDYDIRFLPTTASNLQLRAHVFTEPATTPALSYIHITCPHLPWTIPIHAGKSRFVTVGDVLHQLHRALQTNITSQEYGLLPTPCDRRRVTQAYEMRYRCYAQGSQSYQAEKRGGAKRIDFLMGTTRWGGLSSGRNTNTALVQDNTWVMNVSRPPS